MRQQLEASFSAAFKAICRDAQGPIGLAVSGGSDSIALLHLARGQRPAADFLVLTVDHGLRPEAAEEANRVNQICQSLGLRHQTLHWHPPAGHVSQAKARRARHQLLATALRAAGGSHLLLGHTCDDQLETLVMRKARSPRGLAGMRALSVSPVWPEGRGIFLGRPLLALSRVNLRAMLTACGAKWCDDPSNRDSKFERVRVRAELADMAADDKAALVAEHEAAKAGASARDAALLNWLETSVTAHEDGLIVCARDGSRKLGADRFAEGLGYLLLAASGGDKLSSFASRLRLAEDILAKPDWRARTLGGAWIAPRKGDIHIARDPGEIAALPLVAAKKRGGSERMIWDGRFELSAQAKPANSVKFATAQRAISALAGAGYPRQLHQHEPVKCLVSERLNDLQRILGHKTCVFIG